MFKTFKKSIALVLALVFMMSLVPLGAIAEIAEGNGVSVLTRKICDGIIQIPMFGQINSLNASVSCGITVFEVIRQRLENEKKC